MHSSTVALLLGPEFCLRWHPPPSLGLMGASSAVSRAVGSAIKEEMDCAAWTMRQLLTDPTLHDTTLHCTALHCIAILYCAVMLCAVQYSTVLRSVVLHPPPLSPNSVHKGDKAQNPVEAAQLLPHPGRREGTRTALHCPSDTHNQGTELAMKVVRQARLELSGRSTPDQLRPPFVTATPLSKLQRA